jgi:hypothetical protein
VALVHHREQHDGGAHHQLVSHGIKKRSKLSS